MPALSAIFPCMNSSASTVQNTLTSYLAPLMEAFSQAANPALAPAMEAYMKHFPFLGIKAPERKALIKTFIRQNPLPAALLEPVLRYLWALPEREYQYAGMELLFSARKSWTPQTIELIEWTISHKSWWDTVDALAVHGAGVYFKMYPEAIPDITGRWNSGPHMWLRRTSLLFQLQYKQQTDWPMMQAYILNCLPTKEFFLQKAIGWVLRQYSRVAPATVRDFVAMTDLPALSRREALRLLP